MKKTISILIAFLLFSAYGAMAQLCSYYIIGQVVNSQTNQPAVNQLVYVYGQNGTDTLYTTPNGAFNFSYTGICDSTAEAFTVAVPACGLVYGSVVVVPSNQTVTQTILTCTNQTPTCNVQPAVTTNGSNTIAFNWNGSGGSGVTAQSVVWDMGNGFTTNNYPNGGSYTYSSAGTYQVCVEVTWSNGCVSSGCQSITVGNTVSCPYTISGYVTGLNTQQAMNNIPVTVTVPSGGGSYSTTTNGNGYYMLTLVGPCNSPFTGTVSAFGCGVVDSQLVVFTPNTSAYQQNLSVCDSANTQDSCMVAVSASTSGNVVQFAWTGFNQNNTLPQSVVWDFGDGSSTNTFPNSGSYAYASPGNYTICVTVTWPSGCVASACDSVSVGSNAIQSICGCVNYVDTNNDTLYAGCGVAYLVQLGNTPGAQTMIVDSTNITPNGYCFYGNYSGNYTVWAQPCASLALTQNVLPTYLGGSLSWQNATMAAYGWANYNSNCISLVNTSNVTLQGPSVIGGTILWGEEKAPGDPVVGANVFLFNEAGEPVGFSVTDAEGYYSFSNLAYGTYQIYPEFPGYETHPLFVTVSAENVQVEADDFYLGFGLFSPASVTENFLQLSGLYPNPSEGEFRLSVNSLQAGLGMIQVLDLTGKRLSSSVWPIQKGQQLIELDYTVLPAGIYMLTLQLNGQQWHTKMVIR